MLSSLAAKLSKDALKSALKLSWKALISASVTLALGEEWLLFTYWPVWLFLLTFKSKWSPKIVDKQMLSLKGKPEKFFGRNQCTRLLLRHHSCAILSCSRQIVITVILRWQHVTFYSELFTSLDSELCFSMTTISMPKQSLRWSGGTSRSSQKTPSSQVVITSSSLFYKLEYGNYIWRERTFMMPSRTIGNVIFPTYEVLITSLSYSSDLMLERIICSSYTII